MKGDQVHFCWPDCRCGCQRENQNIKNDCEEDERCISSKFESACCLGKYQNETCFIYVLNNIFMFGNCLLAEDYAGSAGVSRPESCTGPSFRQETNYFASVLAQLLVLSSQHLADLGRPGGEGGGGGLGLFWDRQSCSLAWMTSPDKPVQTKGIWGCPLQSPNDKEASQLHRCNGSTESVPKELAPLRTTGDTGLELGRGRRMENSGSSSAM